MGIAELINLVAALGAFAFVIGVILRRSFTLPQWFFLLVMVLLGLEALFQFASVSAVHNEPMLRWQRLCLLTEAILPSAWLAFSLTFARLNAGQFLRRWAISLFLLLATPIALTLVFWSDLVADAVWMARAGQLVMPMSLAAQAVNLILIIGAVGMLANLEWTFRASVGTARWKIKYAVIGLALLSGARIYTSSQVVITSALNVHLVIINSAALLVACVFLTVAAYRSRLAQIDIYPSTEALHKSMSVILAGIYLVLVGLVAKGFTLIVGHGAFPVTTVLVLLALGGLAALCFSNRVRRGIREFTSAYFRRPMHDYRRIWADYTHQAVAVFDPQQFARSVVIKVLSETFDALSVTVWVADEAERQFAFAASTVIEAGQKEATSLPTEVYEGIQALGNAVQPVDIDRAVAAWCGRLRDSNPSQFSKSGHRYCLPLISGGEIVGLIVIGDRVGGARFSLEDLELLKCLGDQIAASLRNLRLSEKLMRARELEAFQAMSTFLVHDLKNTASALTLTLRNLPAHFENPAFREDALRTLTKSVDRVNQLISRLTMLRQRLELRRTRASLNEVVETALKSAGAAPGITLERRLGDLPLVSIDVEQIESAIVNLVLNARDAMSGRGKIQIETGLRNGEVFFSIADGGCGMSPTFMAQSLFRPFKTSKKNGLGIGMFQTKTIIEAHGGRIAVQSEPGQGSTFQLWLPVNASEDCQ